MSDAKAPLPITEATLTDGTTVAVNDHVYLQPEHLGECYYIGRVMEFCSGNEKRRGLQARIAWYNRPKDVMGRKWYDPRLLVATMHSDLNPVSSIRGKCTVVHKHYIDRLEQYKKQDDHFYYHQLYDRYMQRLYDVVPCELVQNVPSNVQEALRERYQFIVVEQGKASADLTVARRTCCVCHDWCASASSVRCAACQNNYHMSCVNPPLLRKPSKGFAWQCAFCSRKEIQETQQPTTTTSTATIAAKDNKPHIKSGRTAKRQTRTSARIQSQHDASLQPAAPVSVVSDTTVKQKKQLSHSDQDLQQDGMRMTHMWPFRYFGIHTDIHDILDIDDRIYPRARSRIGPRYQAEPIDERPSTEPSSRNVTPTHQASPPPRGTFTGRGRAKKIERRGRPRKKRIETSPGIPNILPAAHEEDSVIEEGPVERGTEATITRIFSQSTKLDEAALDDYMTRAKALESLPIPSHSVDLQTRIVEELERHNYDVRAALDAVSKLTSKDFAHVVEWTDDEIEAFEKAIGAYGQDLFRVGRKVPSKRHADVVRYFYQWKKTDRYEPVYSKWTTIYKPAKRFKKFVGNKMVVLSSSSSTTAEANEQARAAYSPSKEETAQGDCVGDDDNDDESDSEEDATVVRVDIHSVQCANCLATESVRWRRLPSDIDRKHKQFREVLCNSCGEYWLKYSVMRKTAAMVDKSALPRGVRASGRASALLVKETALAAAASVIATLHTVNGGNPMKRKRTESAFASKKRMTFEPTTCAVCTSLEPLDLIFTCYECGMSAHRDCYGIAQECKEYWLCGVCANKMNPAASYVYECILCKQGRFESQQPLKKTSSYNWAHVLCAMFIPEIKFVNTAHLDTVEYVAAIDAWRWDQVCHLCQQQDGACVKCGDCDKAVHVQCAIQNRYKLGFEIIPSMDAGAVTVGANRFGDNSAEGEMVPQVWCPDHDLSHKRWISLSARDVDSGKSCMSVYADLYKQVEPGTTPAMRRYKALVLSSGAPYNPPFKHDLPTTTTSAAASVSLSTDSSSSASASPRTVLTTSNDHLPWQPTCSECPVEISPMWWPSADDPSSGKMLCHRCYWRHRQTIRAS